VRRKEAAGGETPAREQAAALLQDCRRCKIGGDYTGFFRAALDLARMIAPQDATLAESIAAMLEKVQFGGFQPPAEDMERLLRQLEKSPGGLLSGDKKTEPDYQKYCK
jgi:hypothetical protein